MLELRLKTLDKVVDYFVLVEANRTFTNQYKPYNFEINKNKFQKFLHRIVHIKVDDMPDSNDAWGREIHQRNCIMRGLLGCGADDLVLISDVDEIPNPGVLASFLGSNKMTLRFSNSRFKIKNLALSIPLNLYYRLFGALNLLNNTPVVLEQDIFYYYVNCKSQKKWPGCILTKYKYISLPQDLRQWDRRISMPRLPGAGWHFSYLGGISRIADKIKAFAHTEMNTQSFTSAAWIKSRIVNGEDLFCRNEEGGGRFEFMEIDSALPAYTGPLIEKYPYLYLKASAKK